MVNSNPHVLYGQGFVHKSNAKFGLLLSVTVTVQK